MLLASSSLAAQSDRSVGATSDGLAGIDRIALPHAPAPAVALAADVGYGFIESQGDVSGAHHRAQGAIGVGAAITPWFGVGLRFDGRHDVHPADDLGGDSGTVGDPRLHLRAGAPLSEAWLLGGEAVLWLPGQNAPSLELAASTLDARATLAYAPQASPWTIALSTGYRLDNSAQAAPPRASLRSGDRLTLGLSDFDAVLLIAGVRHHMGALELLSELSWDALVGRGAPAALKSPMRWMLGARLALSDALSCAFSAVLSPSGRAQQGQADRFVPIEPRFALQAGLRYAFGSEVPAITHEPEPEASAQAEPVAPVAAVRAVSVTGVVRDPDGAALAGVSVALESNATALQTTTDTEGRYRFDAVPLGEARLHAELNGYQSDRWQVELRADGAELPERVLQRAAVGQLRGLVLSFRGRPLAARITVRSLDRADNAPVVLSAAGDGRFSLDVPPGRYEVEVGMAGYAAQTRSVEVAADAVVILNLDLRGER